MSVKTYAVIPTNGREFVFDCVDSVVDQVEEVILVVNGKASVRKILLPHPKVKIIVDSNIDMNISRWWNLGIDHVASRVSCGDLPEEPWNVLVVNDDVIASDGLVELLN